MSLVHRYNRDDSILGGLNLNKVSDDNYFRDLSTRINIASQATLPREAFLTYNCSRWGTGTYSATARVQPFQVLHHPRNPILVPYRPPPQITLTPPRPHPQPYVRPATLPSTAPSYYGDIPVRDQKQIPVLRTRIADSHYTQLFSEKRCSGGDRINDAHQLRAAVPPRMLLPSSGQEVLRG